nr:MAG TPA: hypothetical protein [Caudoviricetes sp.]
MPLKYLSNDRRTVNGALGLTIVLRLLLFSGEGSVTITQVDFPSWKPNPAVEIICGYVLSYIQLQSTL